MKRNSSGVEWSGVEEMKSRIGMYGAAARSAVESVANYWAPVLESYAKSNAPWNDQTGNARQSLHAFVRKLSDTTVELYLAHGVDYGIYLEIANNGAYGVIWDTLAAHLEAIANMLKGIFGNGNVASSLT